MENIKKELQKVKQEKGISNHKIETLRKLNKIQTQAVLNKEKEIRRLTAIIGKRKERVEQMKLQVIKLQAETKNMNAINTMATKTNHYQSLSKKMRKEKNAKEILFSFNIIYYFKIKECQSKLNIYFVSLKKTSR